MKKILLVSNTDWYLYRFRLGLAKTLRDRSIEVVFVSPQGNYAPKILAEGFRWVPWKLGRKTIAPWWEIKAIIDLISIIQREQPDLIHNHTIKPVIYGSLAARLAGKPLVVNSITGRGYVFLANTFQARVLRPLAIFLYRLAVKKLNCAFIFENQTDKTYFTKLKIINPENSYIVSGTGVDPAHYLPSPEPEGTPLVVYPGRMLWDKGVGDLVEATRLLHSRIKYRLVLVGKPDVGNPSSIPEETIHSWVEEGILEWWGWQEDMKEVYRQSNIVVLPSLAEGMSTTLVEALASKRAIITTDVPGCREAIIPDISGLLVPPQNPIELANAIEKLIVNDQLRGSLAEAGYKSFLQEYTSDIINNQTYAIYQKYLI